MTWEPTAACVGRASRGRIVVFNNVAKGVGGSQRADKDECIKKNKEDPPGVSQNYGHGQKML